MARHIVIFLILLGGTFLYIKSNTLSITIPKLIAHVTEQIIDHGPSDPNADIENQSPLVNPPQTIKAIYATGYSAGNEKKLAYLIDLIRNTELNAIVIDVKDYTGMISYHTGIPEVKRLGAAEARIPKINALIKRLHDEQIYVIGRVAVFEDQKLSLARPELALRSKSKGDLWKDYKGLHWMDTAAHDVWDYNLTIVKDMLARGFDEVNFDYIRFASDGNMQDIVYPVWDGIVPKSEVVKSFFIYLRNAIPYAQFSADLFGMTTTNADDLGIGQRLEDALPYFDAVAPMVYPSHYINGFIGVQNPATEPYKVVRYSMDQAMMKIRLYQKLRASLLIRGDEQRLQQFPPLRATLRPWLQDFDIGADYNAKEVRDQITATIDALGNDAGWMLWNPSNIYTSEALLKNPQH